MLLACPSLGSLDFLKDFEESYEAMAGRVDFTLYLITDRRSLPANRTLENAVAAALDGGVRAIQLREKDLSDAEFELLAEKLRRRTADYNAKLLLNDRWAMAQRIGADGVHLGGHSRPTSEVRQRLGHTPLIGVSTHTVPEIVQAAQQGADFVTFGPVYHTPSKAPMGSPVGLDALEEACALSPIPVFALGGIGLAQVPEIRRSGAFGIGLIRAIQDAASPSEEAKSFCNLLNAPTETP